MRNLLVRSLLLPSVLVLIAFGPGAVSPVLGADCGDGVAPCSCGDTVVTYTRLDGSDPVLRTPCPCDGLLVASDVTLKINGTIRGQAGNTCSGIRVLPGATDVVVTTGRIVGFDHGVEAEGVSQSRFSGLQIVNCADTGIEVEGDDNVIEGNVITGCGSEGIEVEGEGNLVSLNRTENGGGFGIVVDGEENVVSRNLSQRNAFDGIVVGGEENIVDRNRSKYNGLEGYFIDGEEHTVTLNIAEGNGTDGFTVFATESTFTRNRSDNNVDLGIFDAAGGGTTNTYTDNRCTSNGAGPSNVPGAC